MSQDGHTEPWYNSASDTFTSEAKYIVHTVSTVYTQYLQCTHSIYSVHTVSTVYNTSPICTPKYQNPHITQYIPLHYLHIRIIEANRFAGKLVDIRADNIFSIATKRRS